MKMPHNNDSRGRMYTDKRGVATRDQILRQAIRLFAERGYEAASIRHIAHDAGVNYAAINYHFRSKRQLYLTAVAHVLDRGRKRADTLLSPHDGRQSCKSLARWFDNCLMDGRTRNIEHELVIRGLLEDSEVRQLVQDRLLSPLVERLSTIVVEIYPEQSAREAASMATAIIACCMCASYQRLLWNQKHRSTWEKSPIRVMFRALVSG